jgi:hypothetical protein
MGQEMKSINTEIGDWWTRYFLNEGTWNGENLLANLKLDDGAGFRNFVRLTPSDIERLQQVIGCKTAQTKTKY